MTLGSSKRWALVLASLIALHACIRRDTSAGVTESTATGAAPPSSGSGAPTEATGNYGKVPGTEVLGGRGIQAFEPNGETGRVVISTVPVEGREFTEAMRVEIKEPSTNDWDVQVQARNTTAIGRGDVLLATFHFRTEWSPDESGEGKTEFVFELARDPWTKSASFPVRASREWKKIFVPFVAAESYAAGEAQAILRLGYSPETIEIGGVTVENFGKQLALADLPVTKVTYGGMEPAAAWRAEAARRIDEHRKAALTVSVKDAAGRPASGAVVSVTLEKHAFGFGTAVVAEKLAGPGNDRYKELVTELFNVATLENNLKWVALAGDWGGGFTLARAKAAVSWLRERGLQVRGHVLVWPGWKNLPRSLKKLEAQPDALRSEVRDHVRELASSMQGTLVEWDVMNEPFDNHDLMDILGKDVMVEWFREARAADPGARLFINDYAILSGGGGSTPHREHYAQTIEYLVGQGAPLDGIGMQGHFATSLTAPADLLKILDTFAKFGKPIVVTEYDIVLDDEELAARYTRDFYTTLFSHPAVESIIMWGFWDSAHWKQNALMYRKDWSLKPAGKVYRDLVSKEWRTDVSLKTDAAGGVSVRGFLGDYAIVARSGTKQVRAQAKLGAKGSNVVLELD